MLEFKNLHEVFWHKLRVLYILVAAVWRLTTRLFGAKTFSVLETLLLVGDSCCRGRIEKKDSKLVCTSFMGFLCHTF